MRKKKNINILKKIMAVLIVFITFISVIIGTAQSAKADVTYSWNNLYSNKGRYQSNKVEGDSDYGNTYKGMMDSQGWAPAPVYKLYYKLDGGTKTAMSYDSEYYTNGQGGYEIMLRVDGEDKWLGKSSYRNGSPNVSDFYDCWHNIKLSNLYFTPREINGEKFLQINMELTNIGNTPKTFSLATSGDIQIADDDNAAIQFLGNGFSMSNRYCTTSEFYGGSVKTATLSVYAKNAPYVTDADAVAISVYANRRNNIWKNDVLGDTTTKYNFKEHNGNTGFEGALDSSFSIAWKDRTLSPGEKRTYSYIIGVGDYKAVNTIYFNPNTEDIDDYKDIYRQVTFDTTNNNQISNKPTRTGYDFDGWWTTTDDSGIKIYNADGSCNKGTSYWDSSGRWQGFTNITVYAHWKPKQYTITLDSNGATKNGTTSTTVDFRGRTSNITIPQQKYNIRYHTTSDRNSSVFKTDVQENQFVGYYNSNGYSTSSYADPIPVTITGLSATNGEDGIEYSIRDYGKKHTLYPFSTHYMNIHLELNEYLSLGDYKGVRINLDSYYSGRWIIKPHGYYDEALLTFSTGNSSISVSSEDMETDSVFELKATNAKSLDIVIEALDMFQDSYDIELLFVSDKEYPNKTKAIYNSNGVMQYDYNIAKDTTLTAKWSNGGVSIPSTDAYGNKVKYWRTSDGYIYYPFEETDEDEEFSKDTDLYPVYETFLQDVYIRYQHEDGSWDDWGLDDRQNYFYESLSDYYDDDENDGGIAGEHGVPLGSGIAYGDKYTFDTSLITKDCRWNSSAYEMPTEFDDGTEFSYTVTGSNTRYISVKRKAKYIMSFNRGLTDDDSQQMDNITVGEYTSFKLPVNLYKGRRYSVNLDSNGGSNINPINGNLSYDDYCNWKDDYKGYLWGDEDEFNSQYVDNNIIFTMQWESENITLPTPTKAGYTFVGWYEDKAFTKKVNGNTYKVEPDTVPLDVTLYAKWSRDVYQQDIYVRYQNEDGSWGDYSDRYWHKDGYWERFWWHIDNGSPFWFGLEDIEQDSRWDADIYEFPDTFADGSPLRYTVTSANTKYVDIKRKQYAISFNKGLTNSTAIMPSVSLVAGSSYKVPTPEWLGRSYTITLDDNGSKTTISGNLSFDQWYTGSDIGDYDDWYSPTDEVAINEDTQFIANWDAKDITLTTPTKTGYTFDGWYEDEALTKKYNDTTIAVEPDTTKYEKTLYAKWTEETHKSASKPVIIKAASTMYNDTLIKRTPKDDEWYSSVGNYSVDRLKEYPKDCCVQVWSIDENGKIVRNK